MLAYGLHNNILAQTPKKGNASFSTQGHSIHVYVLEISWKFQTMNSILKW